MVKMNQYELKHMNQFSTYTHHNMAADAEFYQCVSNGNVLTYKHICTTNILIKVEKLIKYYTAVAEKI